jgi:hypothetical protein
MQLATELFDELSDGVSDVSHQGVLTLLHHESSLYGRGPL